MKIVYKTTVKPIDEIDKALGVLNNTLRNIGSNAVSELKDDVLSDLGKVPRKRSYPSDYPIEWTSEKQRKAYFASNGFGAGIPYQRTGRGAKSWFIKENYSNGSINVSIGSSWDKAKYVYGDLDINNPTKAMRFMQRFHRITGWQPAREKVMFWSTTIQERIVDKLFNTLDRQLKSVKLTRRTRR